MDGQWRFRRHGSGDIIPHLAPSVPPNWPANLKVLGIAPLPEQPFDGAQDRPFDGAQDRRADCDPPRAKVTLHHLPQTTGQALRLRSGQALLNQVEIGVNRHYAAQGNDNKNADRDRSDNSG